MADVHIHIATQMHQRAGYMQVVIHMNIKPWPYRSNHKELYHSGSFGLHKDLQIVVNLYWALT